MPYPHLLTLLTIFTLAWPGCAAQSREETNVLLQELTFVRAALKDQREALRQLKRQTAALAALVAQMEQAERRRAAAPAVVCPPAARKESSSAPGPAVRTRSPFTPRTAARAPGTAGITRVGRHRYRITRAALNRHLANATRLARGARIVPYLKNGLAQGFKLYRVQRDSLYAAMGLKSGDIVLKINGRSMSSPDSALAVYSQLRKTSRLSMELLRRGKTVVMYYVITD